MAEWNEKDHPRDPDGKFTDANGTYRQNTDYKTISGYSVDHLLNAREKSYFYRMVGEIKRGMFFVKTNGMYLIQVGNKVIFSYADYISPKIEKVVFFDDEELADFFVEEMYNAEKRKRKDRN